MGAPDGYSNRWIWCGRGLSPVGQPQHGLPRTPANAGRFKHLRATTDFGVHWRCDLDLPGLPDQPSRVPVPQRAAPRSATHQVGPPADDARRFIASSFWNQWSFRDAEQAPVRFEAVETTASQAATMRSSCPRETNSRPAQTRLESRTIVVDTDPWNPMRKAPSSTHHGEAQTGLRGILENACAHLRRETAVLFWTTLPTVCELIAGHSVLRVGF